MSTESLNNSGSNSKIESVNHDTFDIKLVYTSFSKCCEDVNAIDMNHYLIGFKELYRFFMLLGSVFGFVASDIISKIDILEEYKQSENAAHYESLQSMIEYERSTGITNDNSRPSGSRTLLRLHRALEFVMHFMKEFSLADKNAKMCTVAQKCYNATLSQYHPWLIRKGAMFAMYTLPARQQIIERVYGGHCDDSVVSLYEKLLSDIADISKKVYEETQKLYEANDLLNLP